jgi:hypothetical protein
MDVACVKLKYLLFQAEAWQIINSVVVYEINPFSHLEQIKPNVKFIHGGFNSICD